MSGLWRRLIELVRPTALDREAREELAHHVELLMARKMAGGLDEREARRQALAEVGSLTSAREQIAEGRTGFALDRLAREVRYAARVLRRSPGVTLLSILTLGVGIGVSAVLFALVDAIVLRPLPFPDADRLVRIFDTNPQAGIDRGGVASGNSNDWRRRTDAFEGLAAFYTVGRTLTVDADSEVLITAQVSRDFFEVLRIPPVIGRVFTTDEIERAEFNNAAAPIGPDPVVMLSHGVWMQRFGGDPSVIGRSIMLERRPFMVVGVMPAGFAMPDARVQLWIPWGIADDAPRDQHYLSAVARLAPGVSIAEAEERLNVVARALADEHPATNRGWSVRLSPLATETVGDAARVLWLLLAAAGLVVLIACANVALLATIRSLDRREETAVRLALGASSARLFRELMLESALVAMMSGLLSLAIAAAGLRLLPTITADLPRLDEVAFDGRTLLFTAGVTALAAFASGLPPAWRRTRVSLLAGLAASARRATDDRRRHWLRDSMVVLQVAMAVVLMIGSGLLVRSVQQLSGTDPGFDPRGVLVAPIFLDTQAYNSGEKTRSYYRRLFEELSALPGVVAVGGASTVPTSPLGPDFERPVWPQGTTPAPADRMAASVRIVTPGYFTAMGLRIVEGRAIDDRDSPQTPVVLMVSETLARRLWPGQRAVGRRLVVDYSTAGTMPSEVVGVVGDLRFRGPRSEPLPEIYLAHAQRTYLIMNVVIKTTGDPRALMPSMRAALKNVDPQKPAHGLSPLGDLMGATYARDRQTMGTLLVFAAAAVFLAVLSVYGALAQRVRERSREIGIRMAMGATAPSVLGWVVGSGLRLITLGLVTGALAARAAGSVLDGVLFGVAAADGLTTMMALAILGSVALVATLIPARRATLIDPVEIFRRG